MSFFYDLNKKLATLAAKTEQQQLAESKKVEAVAQSPLTQALNESVAVEANYSAKKARAGKDIGKPGKNFAKIAKGAAERYGSKAAGERVAGAVLNKLRHPKEDIENEGNAFTGALAKTPKGGKFKVGNKEFTDNSSIEEGFADMDAWLAQREKEKGTGKFDRKERTLPGGMKATTFTRRHDDEEDSDDEVKSDQPKRRGRPKGKDKGPERVTAKSYKYKAGRPTKTAEDLDSDGVMMTRPSNMSSESVDPSDRGEYDQEGQSAKHDIKTIVRHAQALHKILGDDDNLPEWVQSKLAKIEGMMIAVDEYMQNQDQEVSEKAPPGAKAERMVKGIKKSLSKDGNLSAKDKAIAYATTWKARKDGKVEEAGKPDFLDLDKDGDKKEPMKKAAKEKKVDETTVSGSVSTAPAGKKSSGGYNFGGGVYESINAKVENMITEGMNVSVNMASGPDGNPTKNITVSADGEDAEALAMLLKMAGIGGQSQDCGCGNTPCSCEQVDENSPDWPTNTETLDAEPNLRTYSGGLNGPKSTGQTTVPVVASQERRLHSESVELEQTLFNTWKNYKG